MNVMNQYTYNQIKKKKRHTISILAAIIIASALLCSLCIFIHSIWQSKVTSVIERAGYWHGELYDSISGDKLKYVTADPEVESTMVKGQWVTAQLSDSKRPYLLMRDADINFWRDMNLKNNLIEGRLPERAGEIVLSKLFFKDNPSYKIGDELTLPIGSRMLDGEIMKTQDYKREDETFKQTGTKNYTIVGELDVSGVSAYPGYIAMGYLDIADILPDDELTVYIRFIKPQKIYEVLPKIAEEAGLTQDEYGEYGVRYNTALLNLYGISDKSNTNTQFMIMIVIAATIILLVMGAFILIIYNAFSLSANSRIKELSILKSLGATPRQIKYSVLYEGVLLWFAQLPVGIMIGYLFTYIVLGKVNEILSVTEDYRNINISFSWLVIGVSMIISLITVLVSSYIPARKMAKVSPIEGMRQNNLEVKLKKAKHNSIIKKIFGIEGELAGAQFSASRKSLRTAIISLSICFILIAGYLNIISIYNLADYQNRKIFTHDMKVDLNIMDEPDDEMINKIVSLPEVNDSVIRRQVRTAAYVNSDQESDIFAKSGGFEDVGIKYNVLKEDGRYRIIANLVGLSDSSFKKYCAEINTDYEEYYKEGTIKGILLDSTYHTTDDLKADQKIPLLNTREGDDFVLYEKVEDDMKTDYKFDIEAGAVTEISPSDLEGNRYSINFIVPMKTYEQIVSDFMIERQLEYSIMSIDLLVGDENSAVVKDKITQICGSYLGSEDFSIWSLLEDKNYDDLVQKAVTFSVYEIALMIGTIGIFNAFSTILNNLSLRKREFAVLRSIGLTPKGLNKMLTMEGFLFALTPIIISIPIIVFICWYSLRLMLITWSEFLEIMPLSAVFIYSMLIFITIFSAYWISSKYIERSNIIEAVKDEIV